MKYDPRGVEQWAARYTTGLGNGGSGCGVAVDELGHVFVTGYMIRNAGTPCDAMTIKYVETPGGVVGPGEIPARGRLLPTLIRGTLTLAPDIGPAELLDASGRRMMSLTPGSNDVRHLPTGIYFVRAAPVAEHGPAAVTRVVLAK